MQRKKAQEEFGRGMSRRGIMEKELAIAGATNPMESKFGCVLLRGNSQESRLLSGELGRLERQLRRQRVHSEQERKQFLARHTLPDPILIVERPPSPEVLRKQLYLTDPTYVDDTDAPNYMRTTQARARTPSTIHTIDAYSVKTHRKANLWEGAYLSSQKPRFQSTARPSWPLTEADQAELARGWEYHVRPRRGTGKKMKKKRREEDGSSRPQSQGGEEEPPTFITEMAKVRYNTDRLGAERPSKNVSFADEVGMYFKCKSDAEIKRRVAKQPGASKQSGGHPDDKDKMASAAANEDNTLSETTNSRSGVRPPGASSKARTPVKKPRSPFVNSGDKHSRTSKGRATKQQQPHP